jgi:regulator of cell morphogenesis and NO signaling
MHIHPNDTIGDIVASDYRAAAVFERFGLDFCCGGRQTLGDACRQMAVDSAALLTALEGLAREPGPTEDTSAWPLDKLVGHIVSRHHTYVKEAIPVLLAHTSKIAAVHGNRSPELHGVATRFTVVANEMARHMAKEEQILFPYIQSLVTAERAGRRIASSPFGTVQNPIRMMEAEHQDAGDEMREIRDLTHGYALPDFACATYRACFAELQEFERDLHRHVHLENNVLFPRAVKLEQRLS